MVKPLAAYTEGGNVYIAYLSWFDDLIQYILV
jgi:hypothetical protein